MCSDMYALAKENDVAIGDEYGSSEGDGDYNLSCSGVLDESARGSC